MNPIDHTRHSHQTASANDQEYNYESNISHSESSQTINWSKYDLKGAVKLPELEKCDEWIANNLFDFHKQVCMLFGTICSQCTRDKCSNITAGQSELPASDYITLALDWIQEQLDNEEIFPSVSVEKKFPENFNEICEAIARRLFRVYAHVYQHHLTHVKSAKIEAHMNTSLKHFIYFAKEFSLIKEWAPLQDYVSKLDIMPNGAMRLTNGINSKANC